MKSLAEPVLPFATVLQAAPLHCREAVRRVRGQRLVCAGEWRHDEVFVKLYFHRRRRVHWTRELRGLKALAARGVATPDLLFAGELPVSGVLALITRRLPEAVPVGEVWASADDKQRRALLRVLVETLARQHEAGLLQRDLHLGNFLLSGERLYSLDGAGFYIKRARIGKKRGLDNLGFLFAQFYPAEYPLCESEFAAYCAPRGLDPARELAALRRAVARKRAYRTRKYLQKVFRDCTAFASRAEGPWYYVIDRVYDSPALRELLADPGRFVGDDGAWRGRVDGRYLVIARYKSLGWWNRLRSARRTGAACAWREAQRRRLLGLATQRPVALVEQRVGLLRYRGYLISEEATTAQSAV